MNGMSPASSPPSRPIKKHLPISKTVIFTALIFVATTFFALFSKIPVKQIISNYNYDILVLLIVMELFVNLVIETHVMEYFAAKLEFFSKGNRRLALLYIGGTMFIVSALLNNITAVMVILPIAIALLREMDLDRKYINVFFAVLLAFSNTGGAASPIGDFPAVVIMTSGITTFWGYLSHAFPLFVVTSGILLLFWLLSIQKQKCHTEEQNPADDSKDPLPPPHIKPRPHVVRWGMFAVLCSIFFIMLLVWNFVPQNIIPPEMVAVIGYVCAAAICTYRHVEIHQHINMKSILLIASFLYMATAVKQSGVLSIIANLLQNNIQNSTLLLIAIMCITALCAGLFSAGPAAAAMMPVIVELCNTTFAGNGDLVAIAYAASICAGSSLFMSSATAGFILSDRIKHAYLFDGEGTPLTWNFLNYLRYGIVNFIIQLLVAIAWILVAFSLVP